MAKKKAQKEEVIVDVQEVYSKSEQFVERNKKILSILIGVLVLIFLAFFAFRFFVVKPKQESALTELYKSQMYFLEDSLQTALIGDGVYSGSEDVANEYGGTAAGKLAKYMSAIAYRDQGDYQAALDLFKECDFDDEIIGVVATGNVGDMYIELGNIEEGAKWLEDAGRMAKSKLSENFAAPMYMMKASMAYMELEQYDKAKKLLTDIVNEYPSWRNHQMAVKYLGSLNNK